MKGELWHHLETQWQKPPKVADYITDQNTYKAVRYSQVFSLGNNEHGKLVIVISSFSLS